MSQYPVFQYLPFETLITKSQEDYYKVLSISDKTGNSTLFVEYMLSVVNDILAELIGNSVSVNLSQEDRLFHFCSLNKVSFTRKDYMQVFRHLSSASASRDLKMGIEKNLFSKSGDKRLTIYQLKKK